MLEESGRIESENSFRVGWLDHVAVEHPGGAVSGLTPLPPSPPTTAQRA